MLFFPRRVEHAFDVTIQRSHDANSRKHRRAAKAVLLIVSFVWPSFVEQVQRSINLCQLALDFVTFLRAEIFLWPF
jgi:hypothetical protein